MRRMCSSGSADRQTDTHTHSVTDGRRAPQYFLCLLSDAAKVINDENDEGLLCLSSVSVSRSLLQLCNYSHHDDWATRASD